MNTRAILLSLMLLCAVALSSAYAGGGFQTDLVGQIAYVQKEVMDLENAIPDAKMTWRPGKGVRSVSEVYAHISFANFMMGKFLGFTLPEGVAVSGPADGAKWETSSTDKKELAARLVKSFDFLKSSIANMSDADLEKTVEFFGNKMTARSFLMLCLSHIHEHLGQSIAYARMVGVTPPWTATQEAQMKAK
jgi:uncharacterized damage-inducible protein DinB